MSVYGKQTYHEWAWCVLKRESRDTPCHFSPVRTEKEDTIHEPGSRTSWDRKYASTCGLDWPGSGLWDISFYCFSTISSILLELSDGCSLTFRIKCITLRVGVLLHMYSFVEAIILHIISWDKSFHWSSDWLYCLAGESQRSICLYLPRAGIAGTHHQACFLHECWRTQLRSSNWLSRLIIYWIISLAPDKRCFIVELFFIILLESF